MMRINLLPAELQAVHKRQAVERRLLIALLLLLAVLIILQLVLMCVSMQLNQKTAALAAQCEGSESEIAAFGSVVQLKETVQYKTAVLQKAMGSGCDWAPIL